MNCSEQKTAVLRPFSVPFRLFFLGAYTMRGFGVRPSGIKERVFKLLPKNLFMVPLAQKHFSLQNHFDQ